MLICDTSGLLAYFDASDRYNAPVVAAIDADPGPFVVSPYILAELDYLLATRRGVAAELAALDELSAGAWDLATLDISDLAQARALIARYRGQAIGLADASLVVLATRYRTNRLLTLDRRHFAVVPTLTGGPFDLVPPVSPTAG